MNTVGFPISRKENENRRALLPSELNLISNPEQLWFETGYGDLFGYDDSDFTRFGAHIACREEVLSKDIICDPKIGDAEYLGKLKNQTVFGWLHAVQNPDIAQKLINNGLTGYAWEDMFDSGRHIYWRNNEIAGEAAIMHAFQCYGAMPYGLTVAIIGRGNVASGALKILTLLGASVTVYSKRTEELFRRELPKYDVVVNAVLWDTKRKDHLIYRSDLSRMKKGSMIIDISCDRCGGVESSVPTTIESPTYTEQGVLHYVVDHTPSLFYRTASENISQVNASYINSLILQAPDSVLQGALCVKNGQVTDARITEFMNRMKVQGEKL